jgi:hypothetical protein
LLPSAWALLLLLLLFPHSIVVKHSFQHRPAPREPLQQDSCSSSVHRSQAHLQTTRQPSQHEQCAESPHDTYRINGFINPALPLRPATRCSSDGQCLVVGENHHVEEVRHSMPRSVCAPHTIS